MCIYIHTQVCVCIYTHTPSIFCKFLKVKYDETDSVYKCDHTIQLSRLNCFFSVLRCKTRLGSSSAKLFVHLSPKSEELGHDLFRCVLKKCPGQCCGEYTRGLGFFSSSFPKMYAVATDLH